jgi:hypothetical protein
MRLLPFLLLHVGQSARPLFRHVAPPLLNGI